MPPPAVKTIRDLIFYRYSKIIAKQAGLKDNYAFIMNRFYALKNGEIKWSNLTREHRQAFARGRSCAYCDSPSALHFDHIIPLSKGGPDTSDNMIQVCEGCNLSKGDKDLYHWWVKTKGFDVDEIPRTVEGKYLKLIYEIHNAKGTLDMGDLDGDGKLTVFDLGYVLEDGFKSLDTTKSGRSASSSGQNNINHIAGRRHMKGSFAGKKKVDTARKRFSTSKGSLGLITKIKKRLRL